MWFLLSDKFNGSKKFDIRGQHEVLKVTFKVIRVSKTTLGAERSTFMTQGLYQQFLKYTTFSISCNAIVVDNSQHRVCYVGINDHYNYARWLPVHVREMVNLRVKHPAIYRQFADGFFTSA